MRSLVVLAALLTVLSLSVLTVYLYPYYLRRKEFYEKHEFVLINQCSSDRAHPRIHYDWMTFDGVQTNCEEARVFVAVPLLAGTLIDAWKASPIYALIYITDPWIAVAIGSLAAVFIVAFLIQGRIYLTEKNVIGAMNKRTSIPQHNVVFQPRRPFITAEEKINAIEGSYFFVNFNFFFSKCPRS